MRNSPILPTAHKAVDAAGTVSYRDIQSNSRERRPLDESQPATAGADDRHGLLALLPYLFATVGSVYDVVKSINSLVAIGIGLAAGWYGGRLTGSPARIHGTITAGTFSGSVRPAVPGTASSFLGRLAGALLSLLGIVLTIMGVISLVNGS